MCKFGEIGPGYAHHADAPAAGGRGDCSNGGVQGHGKHLRKGKDNKGI
ncbi:Uncharacterised protein [Bordetella pertussis]|nr:Uncharacterised protein [Bordetella pertussis]